jgi:hypothetical protein
VVLCVVVDCCYNGLGILDRIDEFMTYYDDRIVCREKWLIFLFVFLLLGSMSYALLAMCANEGTENEHK